MTTQQHDKLWLIAKSLCYGGAILAAVCAAQIGLLQIEPTEVLFASAIGLVGLGVAIGTYVAVRRAVDR